MRVEVLPPYGFVELVEWTGNETSIVNAARVSLAKESKQFDHNDRGLLRFLMVNGHGSPFEHGFLSLWRVRMPIFVAREWVKHRIGTSYNEESGRYVELRPDFYFPEPENVRSQVGKPGAYTFEQVDAYTAKRFIDRLAANSYSAYENYKWAINVGIAKEQARMFLPLNLYTEIRWACNARSLMKFLSLRNDKDAQDEIRRYAARMEDLFAFRMPHVAKDFVQNGRIAP